MTLSGAVILGIGIAAIIVIPSVLALFACMLSSRISREEEERGR